MISEFTLGICSKCASGYISENATCPTVDEHCVMRGRVDGMYSDINVLLFWQYISVGLKKGINFDLAILFLELCP